MAPQRCTAKFDPFLSLDGGGHGDQILPSGNTDNHKIHLQCQLLPEALPLAHSERDEGRVRPVTSVGVQEPFGIETLRLSKVFWILVDLA